MALRENRLSLKVIVFPTAFVLWPLAWRIALSYCLKVDEGSWNLQISAKLAFTLALGSCGAGCVTEASGFSVCLGTQLGNSNTTSSYRFILMTGSKKIFSAPLRNTGDFMDTSGKHAIKCYLSLVFQNAAACRITCHTVIWRQIFTRFQKLYNFKSGNLQNKAAIVSTP